MFNVKSDLHIDINDDILHHFDKEKINNKYPLIIAGDLYNGACPTKFLDEICKDRDIIFVLGNHDFYDNDYHEIIDYYKKYSESNPRFHFLNNSSVIINNIKYVGGTLWTNIDDINMELIRFFTERKPIKDFSLISYNNRLFSPSDSVDRFHETMDFFEEELNKPFNGKVVVVTHHGPSFKSIHPKFQDNRENCLYVSNLDDFILKHKIDFWVHGHVHNEFDYKIGNCQVICHPKGYMFAYKKDDIYTNKMIQTEHKQKLIKKPF